MKIPMLCSSPATVPTSESSGRSMRGGFGGGDRSCNTGAATAGGGGRRDGEKIGLSRVLDKLLSGVSQSGLGLSVRSGEVNDFVSAGADSPELTGADWVRS